MFSNHDDSSKISNHDDRSIISSWICILLEVLLYISAPDPIYHAGACAAAFSWHLNRPKQFYQELLLPHGSKAVRQVDHESLSEASLC